MRRATFLCIFKHLPSDNFYPRSPCGERHTGQPVRGLPSYFYPRSPCGERRVAPTAATAGGQFLSTLSLRRATVIRCRPALDGADFYPRSPCGERQCARGPLRAKGPFLSTLSLRRATSNQIEADRRNLAFLSTLSLRRATAGSVSGISSKTAISIHALLAESDLILHMAHLTEHLFLSTLSLRRATCNFSQKRHPPHNFYPRSPCGERQSFRSAY